MMHCYVFVNVWLSYVKIFVYKVQINLLKDVFKKKKSIGKAHYEYFILKHPKTLK